MIRPEDKSSAHGKPGSGEGSGKAGGPQGEHQKPGSAPATAGKAAEPAAAHGKGGSSAEELLAAKTRECEDLIEQLKRLAADFSNYQKRADRRLEEDRRLIVRDLVLDLLPGIDNLERTMAAVGKTPDIQVLVDGLRMAHEQLLAGLKKHGVTPIESDGKPFSPEHHEAIAHVPSQQHAEGHVIEELQKGYVQHGGTLRPSRVAVSKGKPQPEPEPTKDAELPDDDSTDGQA
jgi:molecular chaperone GrpE